ncbi:hypothetical protein GGR57DRAFT_31874 [Xylariaceae sp. FL1272]|nr:hypothetical protein GGR57DRAFT_31874 [Xylariaceae sp. FL1272]
MATESYIPEQLATATSIFPAPALTATFIPPASCLTRSAFWYITRSTGDFYLQGPRGAQSSCFPPSFDPNPTAYYSPGVCPAGYGNAACSWERLAGTTTESHFTCCPSYASTTFTCNSANSAEDAWDRTLACVSMFTRPITLSAGVKTLSGASVTPASGPTTVTPLSGKTGSVHAYGFHIAHTGSPVTSSSELPTSSASSGSYKHDDTTRVAVGVGLGVGLSVLIAIAVGYIIWWRRRRRVADSEHQSSNATPSVENSPTPGLSVSPFSKDSKTPVGVDPYVVAQHQQPYSTPPPPPHATEMFHNFSAELSSESEINQQGVSEVMGDSLPPGSTHYRT